VENTSVSGCMIARGAIIKPWLVRQKTKKKQT